MSNGTTAAAPALVLRGTANHSQMELDVHAIAAVLGDDVLPHFYRCFVAVDRILALEQLLVLSEQNLPADSVARSRNLHHLVLLLAGSMYETGAALQGLTSTPFGRTLQTMAAWTPLNQLRAQWNTAPFAATIRNGFAFHFGEIAAYRDGINRGPASAVLQVGDGERREAAVGTACSESFGPQRADTRGARRAGWPQNALVSWEPFFAGPIVSTAPVP